MKIIFTFLILCSIQAFSLDAEIAGESDKVNIKSDSGSFKQKENLIVLTGNVEVVDKKMTVTSDKMTIKLAAKKIKGQSDHSRKAEVIIAEDNIIIKDEKMTATSDRARYVVAQKRLYLTGNPVVRQRDNKTGKFNIYRGSRIVYYTDTKQIDFENLDVDANKSTTDKKK